MALPQIIILGAGLGGTIAAYEIRDATKGKADVMVVNDQENFWFVPSNPWVAVRWRVTGTVLVTVRDSLLIRSTVRKSLCQSCGVTLQRT